MQKKNQSRISKFLINAIDLIRNNQQKTSSLIPISSSFPTYPCFLFKLNRISGR